jgi:hypothetical protein
MKRVIFALGLVVCVFACKKTESPIVPVPVAPIVQEETIKFTTNIDSGIKNIVDTLPLIVNVTSKIPASGIFFNVLVKLTDSSKVIFKIDTLINQNSLSLNIPGFNNLGVFNISVTLTSKSTSSNSLSNNYNYNQRFQINESEFVFNHSKNEFIWKGLPVAGFGSINFMSADGKEMMIITPSLQKDPHPAPDVPTFSLIKNNNNKWVIKNYFDNVNMGMGGRDVEQFGSNGFVWADTGPEPSNLSSNDYPMGNVWIANVSSSDNIQWTKVNKDLSFYHSCYAGDLNKDGLLDIAALQITPTKSPIKERIHPYLNMGNNTFKLDNIIIPTPENGCAIKVQQGIQDDSNCPDYSSLSIIVDDVDGDNKLDIIKASGAHSSTDIVRHSFEVYSDPDGDGKFDVLKFNPLIGNYLKSDEYGVARMKLYDYDKDGKKDLFAKYEQDTRGLSNYSGLEVFRNEGKGVFKPSGMSLDIFNNNFLMADFDMMDVDNDGDLDVVFNAFKNIQEDELIYGFSGKIYDNISFNNIATVNFDKLIYFNENGKFVSKSLGLQRKFNYAGALVWIKPFKVNNKFKFVCLFRKGDYNIPSSYSTSIVEVYPKF